MPQRKTYLVHLIVDDAVIDKGTTPNLRHALRGAYEALQGVPGGEATVRAGGDLVFYLATDGAGQMKEVEYWQKRVYYPGIPYAHPEVRHLNPQWAGWPQRSEA